MGIKSEIYESFPDGLNVLSERLKGKPFSLDEYVIVLTPDRYTLNVEKRLFGGGGSLNVEVLTLSRLCKRVVSEKRILSKEGGVMLVARAIAEVAGELTYYAHAAKYADFARETYGTLLQIESSCADLNELIKESRGATAEKLHDLSIIKEAYDRLKSDSSDSPDRLKDLIAMASSSELVRKSDFYAIGYKDATRLNHDVFEALARSCRSFTLIDAEPPIIKESLPVWVASDSVTQYKRIAVDIIEYVKQGGAFGDISVVCGDDKRALERLLNEYGIRAYSDSIAPLFDTTPLVALNLLYRLKGGNDASVAIAYAKNPFSGIDRCDAERLELELGERGIDFMSKDFEPKNEGAARALSKVREAVLIFRGQRCFADAVERIAEVNDYDSNEYRLYEGVTDTLTPMRRIIELLRRFGGFNFDTDANMFFASAKALNVNSIPARSDVVTVCDASALRLTRCRKLYVADFNEGVLPKSIGDNGLLSDGELSSLGGAIEPTVREKNRRDREELLAVISNSDECVLACVEGNGKRRSAFVTECAEQLVKYDLAIEYGALKGSDDIAMIVRHACTPAAAREIAARGMSKHAEAIAKAVDKAKHRSPDSTDSLELEKKSLSVSELKNWFACPYKRFLMYSVGVSERKKMANAADFGVVMHELMRRWAKSKRLDSDRATIEKLTNDVLDDMEIFIGEKYKGDRKRIIDDAIEFIAVNKTIIDAGNYMPDPNRLEIGFGGAIELGDSGLPFVGVIDRVDSCGGSVRVVDYKTGSAKFSVKAALSGEDLQLPLYVAALQANGERVTGAFYVKLVPTFAKDPAFVSGCMVKDTTVALDYDKSLNSGEKSTVYPISLKFGKDGKPIGFSNGGNWLMEEGEFNKFVDTCVHTAGVAADEICSGFIKKTPTSKACEYCPYKALCGDKVIRSNYDEEDVD